MKKKIELLKIPEAVEISENLTQDEKPVTRDKSLKKAPKHITPSGAFHEKKDKNKKVNLGGKRRQENLRRIAEKNVRTKPF
jgi:ATP-dependent RNA helicase RhlE